MRISIIGSGNVASHLGQAFSRAGHTILGVWSKTYAHAQELAAGISARPLESLSELSAGTELCLLAVKDDAIESVLSEMRSSASLSPDMLLAHTAGSVPMEILAPYASRHGVFYPYQTFSKSRKPELSDLPLCLEANSEEGLRQLEKLADSIGGKAYRVDSSRRRILHLAAVFACNFPNHLYAVAGDLLEKQGLPFEMIRPLIRETAAKALAMPPEEAQTGPAVRGDRKVISAHMQQLGSEPELAKIYELLTESILAYHKS